MNDNFKTINETYTKNHRKQQLCQNWYFQNQLQLQTSNLIQMLKPCSACSSDTGRMVNSRMLRELIKMVGIAS